MTSIERINDLRIRFRRFSILYLKTLALMLTFSIVMSVTYIAQHHARIFPKGDQIVVYGRDSCSITKFFRRQLDDQNIPYIYANIDKPLIDQEMWFKANLPDSKTRVTLPMVQIAGRFLESPVATEVIALRGGFISHQESQN